LDLIDSGTLVETKSAAEVMKAIKKDVAFLEVGSGLMLLATS